LSNPRSAKDDPAFLFKDGMQGKSPDRLNAATIAITELMIEKVRVCAEVGVTVIG
jgi:phage terminase large subunit-like protein